MRIPCGGRVFCCFGTTRDSHHGPHFAFGLPMLSPLWHNGMQLLVRFEKVPMAGAKGNKPCQFYPLEERFHE